MKGITGMLMARPSGAKTEDGREIVMLFGVVAAPKESGLKEGHQFVVAGTADGLLHLDLEHPIDRSAEVRGNSPTGIICSPIWRV